MNLNHLTDKTLLQDTKLLVQKEKEITCKLIYHLMEIDRRRLYAELKYSSLFDYCVRSLDLSEGAAHRRIATARLMNKSSEVKKSVEEGKINITAASTLSGHMKNNEDDKVSDLLEIAQESSSTKELKNKLEERVIEKFHEKQSEKNNENQNEMNLNEPQSAPPKKQPLAFKTSINLSEDEMKLLRELKAELGLSDKDLLLKLMKDKKKDQEKKKFKDLKKDLSKNDSSSEMINEASSVVQNKKHSRNIPAKLKREIAVRANKKCENCRSSIHLEYHHIKPFSFGGKHELENIKLLCWNCHMRESIKFFGHRSHESLAQRK